MKREDWQKIVELLDLPVCCSPNFRLLSQRFGVNEDTLGSIYSQEIQRRVIHSNARLQEQVHSYAASYWGGDNLLDLCCKHNWPPCVLLRRLLETSAWKLNRQKITDILRDPILILEADRPAEIGESEWNLQLQRMYSDIQLALLCDPSNAPKADVVRREMGLHYEAKLAAELGALGLAFFTEDDLRAKGFFKTPDAKLQVPFMYQGKIVNWIDSKATFGGEYIHLQQCQEQYQKYVNRYGAGMVIYWFGLVDELAQNEKDIILVSAVPPASAITRLDCLEIPQIETWP